MRLNLENSFIKLNELKKMQDIISFSHRTLENMDKEKDNLVGWLYYPFNYDEKELNKIKIISQKIQNDSEVFIVIGIGGSYLGARACIEALSHNFHNIQSRSNESSIPEIYYIGHNISAEYLLDLIDIIKDRNISVNVISKSGTTMETLLAFRVFKDLIEKKYGKKGSKKRIYITTDSNKGSLRELANNEGYESFNISTNIGGRYSFFTPVGLFPAAVAGIDIEKLIGGAKEGSIEYKKENIESNICYQYAASRNILYSRGKDIEILTNFNPKLYSLGEWWKQLFGESEGKNGKGIFPSTANFTTDLHSFGQLIQDGKRNIFETIINIEKPKRDILINEDSSMFDGLNYLENESVEYINNAAYRGVVKAHSKGKIPIISIDLPEMNEFYFGKLIYFFQKACAISATILGVNPFDQPAVEEYKNNMYLILKKETVKDSLSMTI